RGTAASPTKTLSGDAFGQWTGCGHDGTNLCGYLTLPDAQLLYVADGDFSTTDHRSRMEFYVTPANSGPGNSLSRVLAGTIASSGELDWGATTKFSVTSGGNITKVNNVPTSFPSSQGAAYATYTNSDA